MNKTRLLVRFCFLERLLVLQVSLALALAVDSVPAEAVKAFLSQTSGPERVHVGFTLHFSSISSTLLKGLFPRQQSFLAYDYILFILNVGGYLFLVELKPPLFIADY
jgi:hypothetical protein